MEIVTVTYEGLGHSSHVVPVGAGAALVIDPARFRDRQRRIAVATQWRIDWPAAVRSAADDVTGSPQLAVDGADALGPSLERAR